MPQMAPISWLFMYMLFSIMFIIFSTINFFNFLPMNPNLYKMNFIKKMSMNWKW